MQLYKSFILIHILLFSALSYAQIPIAKDEKKAVINEIKLLIDSNYLFKDKAELINEALEKSRLSGRFDSIKNHKKFADELTESLVTISKDKHFKVQYNPELVKSRRQSQARRDKKEENSENRGEEEIDWNFWYAQKENFGFEKVEILSGNIGYIKLNFWQPLDWAKPTIDATMQFVSHTDALIIDLTENQGGYSPTDSYLASYFFKGESTLWMSTYERRTGEKKSVYTFQEVGGDKYLDRPIYILVSENSFSLAESFTYGMKHFEKATIVGQTSAGAAHAIDFIEVNDDYLIQLPISYSIHPVTKKDWEGTGVIPHIRVGDSKSLKVAYLAAIDKLIPNAEMMNHKELLKRYNQIKLRLQNNSKDEKI